MIVNAVDYDLVIIGATHAGLVLAQKAIAQGLQVALVQQVTQPLQDIQIRSLFRVLEHCSVRDNWDGLSRKVEQAIAPTDFYDPLAKLMEKGVDVISESGMFQWQPEPIFMTETRELPAKNFVIATGTIWTKSDDARGLSLPDFLQPSTWDNWPQTIVLREITPALLQLAYYLAQQGKAVQLLLNSTLFGTENQRLTHRLQTFLETTGIEVYRDLNTTQEQELLSQQNIYIVDGDRLYAHTNNLNLWPEYFRGKKHWLRVNNSLQTSTQNIYGCGAVLGGYDLPEVAIAEADFLVQAFTQKQTPLSPYPFVPYRLFEPYPFDHVGYHAQDLPKDGQILDQTFLLDAVDQLRFPFDLTAQLLINVHQELLGATILGDRSGKLIYTCRELIRNQKPFTSWPDLLEYAGITTEICW